MQMLVRLAAFGVQLFGPITILACIVCEFVNRHATTVALELSAVAAVALKASVRHACSNISYTTFFRDVLLLLLRAEARPAAPAVQCCRRTRRKPIWQISTLKGMWPPRLHLFPAPPWAMSAAHLASTGAHISACRG